MLGMHDMSPDLPIGSQAVTDAAQTSSDSDNIIRSNDSNDSQITPADDKPVNEINEGASCGFKMEKPKMPTFSGDVREYAIFRSDFKHAIEAKYSKRD